MQENRQAGERGKPPGEGLRVVIELFARCQYRASSILSLVRGQALNFHPRRAAVLQVERTGRRDRQVDDTVAEIRAAIVDAHHDRFTRTLVRHAHVTRHGQRAVCRCHRIHVVALAAGSAASGEFMPVPRCSAFLMKFRYIGCSKRLRVGQRRARGGAVVFTLAGENVAGMLVCLRSAIYRAGRAGCCMLARLGGAAGEQKCHGQAAKGMRNSEVK